MGPAGPEVTGVMCGATGRFAVCATESVATGPCVTPAAPSPTAARSRSARSGQRPSWARRRSRCSPMRTGPASIGSRPTRPTRSVSRATRSAPTSTTRTSCDVAVECGADAIYPGYGFLSENPDLAEACESQRHGLHRPACEVLHLTGNKSRAIEAARRAGLPTLRGCPPVAPMSRPSSRAPRRSGSPSSSRRSPAAAAAACVGSTLPQTCAAPRAAMREAEPAFGDPTVFIEQAVINPRHIEVQILADGGRQRRAPLRARLLGAAPPPEGRRDRARAQPRPGTARPDVCRRRRFAREIGYVNAGTVEFLLAEDGRYVFIEMNPRIQVEHTVTEEVTDVDLVVADAHRLGRDAPGPRDQPGRHHVRGAALQCRITTEDPSNGFRPDAGRSRRLPLAGGSGGVRLDGGTVFVGAQVSPHFDSMLVKLTCRGRDLPDGGAPGPAGAGRVPHPRGVHQHPLPRGGARRPGLPGRPRRRRASSTSVPSCSRRGWPATAAPSLLTYLADVTVNQPHGPATTHLKPRTKLPTLDTASPPPGARDLLCEVGPGAVRPAAARAHRRAGHRHDLPRRPPEPARHPDAHPRPAARRGARVRA
jgi:pyruvate carboxylase